MDGGLTQIIWPCLKARLWMGCDETEAGWQGVCSWMMMVGWYRNASHLHLTDSFVSNFTSSGRPYRVHPTIYCITFDFFYCCLSCISDSDMWRWKTLTTTGNLHNFSLFLIWWLLSRVVVGVLLDSKRLVELILGIEYPSSFSASQMVRLGV